MNRFGKTITYTILIIYLIITIVPIYWSISSSLKPTSDILKATFWPTTFTLNHYKELFNTLFPRLLLNSIIITLNSVVLGLFVCSLAGFAFAKYTFPFKNILFWLIIASVSIPPVATIVPLFGWMVKLRWINTYRVLILPMSANAFAVFMLRQYMKGIPNEIMDAARMDGASEFQIYYKIILPISKPALGTGGIFIALLSWNAYLLPLIMLRTSEMYTIPVGLATLKSPYEMNYGLLMAGAVISIIPMLIFFLLMQKQYIEGITKGALK